MVHLGSGALALNSGTVVISFEGAFTDPTHLRIILPIAFPLGINFPDLAFSLNILIVLVRLGFLVLVGL